ncbi:MAG: hypothetical protein LBP95_07495 [Deltaproteobacteria bacterium]|nr:hypothetical protein [Deltaproteobacteria bacterium]
MSNHSVKLAVVVNARRELHLSAGEVRLDELDKPEFLQLNEEILTVDGPAYMKVGLAQIGSVQISGLEVVNVDYPGDSLEVFWYLPDEEDPSEAREVPVSRVGLIPGSNPRPRAEPGHVWRFRVEGRGPVSETYIFQAGFQPPFKPSDLTFHLTDLGPYGFDSLVISRILYSYRAPAYSEGDLGLSDLISEGLLED